VAAFNLYKSLDSRTARRTTWETSPASSKLEPQQVQLVPAITVNRRQRQHWKQQRTWLREIYPPALTWHLPFHLHFFQPGLVGSFYRYFNEMTINQWSATQGRELLGELPGSHTTSMPTIYVGLQS
jgi:hypothetical protein